MFYNTGIATYIWVLTNRKPEHRQGKVQLIDATKWFRPLRKNLGKKNCELVRTRTSSGSCRPFLKRSRRPRSQQDLPERGVRLLEGDGRAAAAAARGSTRTAPIRAKEIKALKESGARRRSGRAGDPQGAAGIGTVADPLHGTVRDATIKGKPVVVEYEPDTDLRDTEQIPLLEEGGIEAFIAREVLPYAPDAWIDPDDRKIGYEIASRATSTSRSRCGRWRRSGRTSWRWRRRRRGCLDEIVGDKSDERNPRQGQDRPRTAQGREVLHRLLPARVQVARQADSRAGRRPQRASSSRSTSPGTRAAKVAEYPHYFLGSIIISKKESASYIVDGQQRLTSLTLLLICLRNLQKDRPRAGQRRRADLLREVRPEVLQPPRRRAHALHGGALHDGAAASTPTDRSESVQNLVAALPRPRGRLPRGAARRRRCRTSSTGCWRTSTSSRSRPTPTTTPTRSSRP